MKDLQFISYLFSTFGNFTYGENMSIISHSVQSAHLAQNIGLSSEMVVAAFLHDIGHMLPPSDFPAEDMDGFGNLSHETSGAKFLEISGFGLEVTVPVKNHVLSKRYLCTVNKDYYETLSLASKKTLEFQGGLLSEEELAEFVADPYFEQSVKLRWIDDEAKEENYEVLATDVDNFLALCKQVVTGLNHD